MHSNRHENYEILNLIGYGLAKFDQDFIKEFGFNTKSDFYRFCVQNSLANTTGTVKNRMDLFDHFFPNNGRKGWWQKGDAYIHRKILIDSLFGNEDVSAYAKIVQLYMAESLELKELLTEVKPLARSKFRKLQETGLEAELFFMQNYQSVDVYKNGILEDARLYGDGYDFQISVQSKIYLSEVKGIRASSGRFRLTENEYERALEYKERYIISVILGLDDIPTIISIPNPIKNLKFIEKELSPSVIREYHLETPISEN